MGAGEAAITNSLDPLSLTSHKGSLRTILEPMKNKNAFSLIEVLMVVTLLSLIIFALMEVFNSTQRAFRSGVTQTDLLETSQAAMGLVASDLKLMAPSGFSDGVNFYAGNYQNYKLLEQPLVGSSAIRTNALQSIFILSRGSIAHHDSWIGIGYTVYLSTNSTQYGLYSLYRFATNFPVNSSPAPNWPNSVPNFIYNVCFVNFLIAPTNYSLIMNGVIGFTAKAFGPTGSLLDTNTPNVATNASVYSGEGNSIFSFQFTNTMPSTAEIEMTVLEDNVLKHAMGLNAPGQFPWDNAGEWNYLQQSAGRAHVFRQRIAPGVSGF